MKMTFRWYGETDSIPLEYIAQIPGMSGVVSAIYDVPVGEVWPLEKIQRLVAVAKSKNLECEVIESVPVHEDIKLGLPTRDRYIENYCENIRNLAKCGVKVICYNFMPVFDWLRSDLEYVLPDGSTALIFNQAQVDAMDPRKGDLSLPGWDSSYTKEGLNALLDQYKDFTEEDLWANMKYFLEKIIPVCEQVDVKMAIHPDDPPWSIFGLPRIITNEANLDRFLKLVDSPYNGLTLCTGSLGSSADNDVEALVAKYADRIHFLHLRNILLTEDGFEESGHLTANGSLDMYAIVKAAVKNGFEGYVRPDHGRMVWGETGKPGYGLYDRALGAAYINGLFEAAEKELSK